MGDSTEFLEALHIAGSDSPAGCLKQAFRLSRDRVLINEDALCCGPAPATTDLNLWRSTREMFLKKIYAEWLDFSFDIYAENGLLKNASRLGQEDAVVAWAGLGLADQLFLAWVIFLFDRVNADLSRLRIVQFETLRPGQQVITMGELNPENIRNFHPVPKQLDSAEVDELRRVWKVYTSSKPADLASYITGANPISLARQAVRQLVYRYPDIRTGLCSADENLLRYTVEQGLKAARVVGHAMAFGEPLDPLDDSYLFYRLVRMASVPYPLVSLTGNIRSMRECQVSVTPFGERVLAGEVNAVHENGIDDWIGGVHLSDGEATTFRDGDLLILA